MKNIKVVVPVSGGKDSQACLKLALEMHAADEVIGLFCDTKFEHPKTYEHVEWMRGRYGVNIETVSNGDVLSQCVRWGRFPGGGSRHCTDYLKMKPTRDFLANLSLGQGGFEVWYGMRTGESSDRAERYRDKLSIDLFQPHELFPSKYPKYLGERGVRFRVPIIDWTSADVFKYLGGEENPLYAEGFDRVGCFPCLASGDKWKEKAFAYDSFGEAQKIAVMDVSEKIGKSIWTSKGGMQRNNENQGCLLCQY